MYTPSPDRDQNSRALEQPAGPTIGTGIVGVPILGAGTTRRSYNRHWNIICLLGCGGWTTGAELAPPRADASHLGGNVGVPQHGQGKQAEAGVGAHDCEGDTDGGEPPGIASAGSRQKPVAGLAPKPTSSQASGLPCGSAAVPVASRATGAVKTVYGISDRLKPTGKKRLPFAVRVANWGVAKPCSSLAGKKEDCAEVHPKSPLGRASHVGTQQWVEHLYWEEESRHEAGKGSVVLTRE
eukprot:scaffold10972_cov127-Isochrysis_galbana.AAC.8